MMRLFINFLKVSKTIGRPLNYEDLVFEIWDVWGFTEGSQITNLRSSRKSVSPIWRKFDQTQCRRLERHHDFRRNLMISLRLWKSLTWKMINFLRIISENFSKKVSFFCPNFFSKLQNHQLKSIFQCWENPLQKVKFCSTKIQKNSIFEGK